MTVTRVSPIEAHELTERGYTYVDVRTVEEFADGHPAGSLNVPFLVTRADGQGREPNPRFLEVMRAAFDKKAPLVLGCRSGNRSMRAAEALLDDGFSDIVEQRAGWDGARDAFGQLAEPGWSRIDLPVTTGAPAGLSYADVLKKVG